MRLASVRDERSSMIQGITTMADYFHVGLGMFLFGIMVFAACGCAIQALRDTREAESFKWDFPISVACGVGAFAFAYVAADFGLSYVFLLA